MRRPSCTSLALAALPSTLALLCACTVEPPGGEDTVTTTTAATLSETTDPSTDPSTTGGECESKSET